VHVAGIAAIVFNFLNLTVGLWGWPLYTGLLSLCAILTAVGFMVLCDRLFPKGCINETALSSSLRRWRLLSKALIAVLFSLAMIGALVLHLLPLSKVSDMPQWIVSDGRPVFEQRRIYYGVGKHGDVVPISEGQYRFLGTVFDVGWSLFFLIFVVVGFHILYFGEWPFLPSQAVKDDRRNEASSTLPKAGQT
jgi:hypothetical protein